MRAAPILVAAFLACAPSSVRATTDETLDRIIDESAIGTLIAEGMAQHSGLPLVTTYKPYLGRLGPTFQEWFSYKFDAYADAFVTSEGRVVDAENRGISHSEGQGYGMLLSVEADDRVVFSRIWAFTQSELQRPDALFSWRYDPSCTPPVNDPNNATDGDVLIATALALAAIRWGVPEYWVEAERIAAAIRAKLVVEHDGIPLLLPGEKGFHREKVPEKFARLLGIEAETSPVFNLSYWIYFALPLLDRLHPDPVWRRIETSGLALTATARGGPTDWSVLSDDNRAEPAPGRPRVFGYNSIRIPLYLLLDGFFVPALSDRLHGAWGTPSPRVPFTFRHGDGARLEPMNLSGYRLIHSLTHCVATGETIDMALLSRGPDTYYSTSLFLLAVNVLYTHYPGCFPRLDGNWP